MCVCVHVCVCGCARVWVCSNLISQQEAEGRLRDSEDLYAKAKSQYERPSSSASVFRPVDYWVRVPVCLSCCCTRSCLGIPCAAQQLVCIGGGDIERQVSSSLAPPTLNPPLSPHTHTRTHVTHTRVPYAHQDGESDSRPMTVMAPGGVLPDRRATAYQPPPTSQKPPLAPFSSARPSTGSRSCRGFDFL